MKIIISDYYAKKDISQILEKADLQSEIEYHISIYGQKPKYIYIAPVFEWNKYKCNKNNMILTV